LTRSLLAGPGLPAALARWRQRYDFVLIDSAPVMPVADARIVAGHADGIVMVVREEHCRRAEVSEAFACLATGRTRLLGVVFVGLVRKRHYYDSYYSRPYENAGTAIEPTVVS